MTRSKYKSEGEKMKAKDSFILYTDQKAVVDKLSDEQAGKIMKAIYEYTTTGELPELDNLLDLVITPFITAIDKNNDRYNEVCEKNRKNGSKGGRPKNKTEENRPLLEKPKKPTAFKKTLNDNDNDSDNDNNNISIGQTSLTDDVEQPAQKEKNNNFEEAWREYPRKEKKQDAYRNYLTLLKGKEVLGKKVKFTHNEIMLAVKQYAQDARGKELRYIPYGSTFFNNAILDYLLRIREDNVTEIKQEESEYIESY